VRLKRGAPKKGAGVAVILSPPLMIFKFSIAFTVSDLHDFWFVL
jgi:hypothetical protein